MKTRQDYNYRQLSIILDLDIPEDKEMMEWLDEHKNKRNGYGVQIRKALKKLIQEEKQANDGG